MILLKIIPFAQIIIIIFKVELNSEMDTNIIFSNISDCKHIII